MKCRLSLLALWMVLATCISAHASVLTFEGLGPNNYDPIPGTYGDNLAGTPHVSVEYFTRDSTNFATVVNPYLEYWHTDYGDLVDVAFPSCNGGCFGVLSLVPDAGYAVRLNSFDLAGYFRSDHTSALVFVSNDLGDGSGSILVNYSPVTVLGANGQHSSFAPGVLNSGPISILFAVNDWNIGLDNVNFDECVVGANCTSEPPPSGVPEPATLGLLSFGLAAVARRARRAVR